MRWFLFVAALVAALCAAVAAATPLPGAVSCRVFPVDNAWNRRVDTLPVAGGSTSTIAAIGPTKTMHADFGSGLYQFTSPAVTNYPQMFFRVSSP